MKSYQTRQTVNQVRFNNGLTWAWSALFLLLSIQWQPVSLKMPLFYMFIAQFVFSILHQTLLKSVSVKGYHSEKRTRRLNFFQLSFYSGFFREIFLPSSLDLLH